MKMNKKGFTLIEMLVVIAIIAVLVAIVIPTVTSATGKAEAAANAANLRSLKAEVVTAMLSGDESAASNGGWTFAKDGNGKYTGATKATVPFDTADNFWCVINGTDVKVYYEGHTIAYWADLAEGKTNSEAAATKPGAAPAAKCPRGEGHGDTTGDGKCDKEGCGLPIA